MFFYIRCHGLRYYRPYSCDVSVCFQGLKMSVLWTLFYGILSAFAPIYAWILFLRALVGFGIGGAPQS